MFTIGLIGGIASGKSTVAKILHAEGALVVDADRFAHETLDDPDIANALVERWGERLRGADGKVDRQQIAERVFGAGDSVDADRTFLESLVHPRVRERLRQELDQHASRGGRAAVLDVPLLLEAGWRDLCDLVLFVDCPEAVRLARAVERGWDRAELAQREAAQLPIREKKAQADEVILNHGDQHDLERRVHEFWRRGVVPRLG